MFGCDICKLLFESGANCNGRNIKIVQLLLDYGADIKLTIGNGCTVVPKAAWNKNGTEVLQFMLQKVFYIKSCSLVGRYTTLDALNPLKRMRNPSQT